MLCVMNFQVQFILSTMFWLITENSEWSWSVAKYIYAEKKEGKKIHWDEKLQMLKQQNDLLYNLDFC